MVKRLNAVVLLSAIVAGALLPHGALAQSNTTEPFLMLYYPSWQREIQKPSQIPWDSITHIMVGPVVPRPDGSINTEFGTPGKTTGERWMKDAAMRAKKEGVTPVLFVGGASAVNQWQGAANSENRSHFAKNLVAAAEKYGYEGIDLDWEPLRRSDYILIAALAAEIRKLNPDLVLTLPVGYVNDGTVVSPLFATVARQFDYVSIMTYDMAGSWPGWEVWHHSALRGATKTTPSSIESAVNAYLATGVPKTKLGIGVPQYGYCWSGPSKPKDSLSGSAPSAISYIAIMEDYYKKSARKWDRTAQMPYLSFSRKTGDKECTFISYVDAEAAQARGEYVKDMGLAGAIVWSSSQAYLPDESNTKRYPIIDALNEALE